MDAEEKVAHLNDISLAQWALVEEIRAGKWTNLDFPRIARKEFGLNGIEFVNTFFEVPTEEYLKQLKTQAENYRVEMVLIMVDDEGDGSSSIPAERKQFAINHRKWVDIASYLGCKAIRTNCRGDLRQSPEECLKWAIESYYYLLEYASDSGVEILIENHGGWSNNPDWMVSLMQKVHHPLLGIYPDWREPGPAFDNVEFLKKTLPYAKGMSYRNQPTEELTAEMISLCKMAGYQGWYGIESDGRVAIKKGIDYLRKYLLA